MIKNMPRNARIWSSEINMPPSTFSVQKRKKNDLNVRHTKRNGTEFQPNDTMWTCEIKTFKIANWFLYRSIGNNIGKSIHTHTQYILRKSVKLVSSGLFFFAERVYRSFRGLTGAKQNEYHLTTFDCEPLIKFNLILSLELTFAFHSKKNEKYTKKKISHSVWMKVLCISFCLC